MRFEDVDSVQELNQKVSDYIVLGYRIKSKTSTHVQVVKNEFSWGIFIVLFFLLIIGAVIYLIYWAVRSKDEVIIRVKNEDIKCCEKCGEILSSKESKFCQNFGTKNDSIENENKCCENCGEFINDYEKSKFCKKCGTEIVKDLIFYQENGQPYKSDDLINCQYCDKKIPMNLRNCPYCEEDLGGELFLD